MSKVQSRLLLLLSLSALPFSASADFYCCQDGGRRVCGDTLPDVCRGRAYKLLDKSGNLLKDVGPPLTAEQKAALLEEQKRQKEQEEKAREQRRRDQALLDTYSSIKDIDISQEKAENDVKLSIKNVEAQIQLTQLKRKKFEDEAEFYKKKQIPPEVQKGLQLTNHELKLQEELLELKQSEFAKIKAKYDGERQRFIELSSIRRSSAAPAATGTH